jgi:hypothetical protein
LHRRTFLSLCFANHPEFSTDSFRCEQTRRE